MENYEEKKNGTASTVVSYLIVIVMTILIGITFVKTTIVRQTSMLPTLQDGNYLLLSKQAYVFNEFKHEDIVVFDSGEMADTTGSLLNFDNKKYYIKRIIGLPGDEITIKNKKVYRNGKEIDQSYTLDKATETNGNGQVEVNKLKIPKGKLFVLGDNRYNSADSRSTDVGLVSMDKVYGKAVLGFFRLNISKNSKRETLMAKKGKKTKQDNGHIIANNRKALHEYFVDKRYEAGIVLTGTEIKSIRKGNINIKEGYARIEDGECILFGVHISPYEQGNQFNSPPLRNRKLLLHRQEIRKIMGSLTQKGYTLIPLKVYITKSGIAKVELGLCRGKKIYDKRESIAKKDAKRNIQRELKMNNRGVKS